VQAEKRERVALSYFALQFALICIWRGNLHLSRRPSPSDRNSVMINIG
jgi:hypothetical protein